jgi:P27 family predicted phage terminase small subunit
MTEIDGAALAIYCQAWARWIEAEQNLVRYGVVVKSPSGFPMQSPFLTIANKAMEQMTRLLVEFGMSPSSRTRVTAVPRPEKQRPPARWKEGSDPRELLRVVQ